MLWAVGLPGLPTVRAHRVRLPLKEPLARSLKDSLKDPLT